MPSPEVSSPTTKRSAKSLGVISTLSRSEFAAMIMAATEALASTEPRPEIRVEVSFVEVL